MDPTLRPGDRLAHYKIVSILGSGGMGQVYLAEDTRLDRQVALKILPPELSSDTDRMRRFISEAKSASAVKHPNVAHIYDVGEDKGLHFIAMEYIEGQILSDILNQSESSIAFILDTAISVADALDEAHSSGIVHRDLKPANLMITRRGQVKVLDFGLARQDRPSKDSKTTEMSTRSATTPGVVMGTVPYMSPEQVLGKKVDARSDLFSFGIILYQMLTRRLPFSGDSTPELVNSILNKQPEPISRFHYDLPPELERIVRKCMEKDPENRYQSARELLIDLRSLKRDTQSGASEAPPSQRKHLSRKAVVFAGIALLALISAWLLWPRGEPLRSIAVLPFQNSSNQVETEYLSEGIPESLINNLSKIPELVVISRTSSFAYKDSNPNIQKIADELKVRTVLTGRITQRDDELSISVELVDANNNRQIWGEKYDRKMADLLGVQEDITNTILENLRLKLTGDQKDQITRKNTKDSEAYQLYLKGRYHWNKLTVEGTRKAIDYFQQAIVKDPSFALAYAGLADAYGLVLGDTNIRPREAVPKAIEAANRALQLDNTLAEPLTVKAVIACIYDYDFPKCEEMCQQAIRANPNYAIAHHQFAWSLTTQGKFSQAILEFQKAQQLDPLSVLIQLDLTAPYAYAGRFDQAFQEIRKAEEMDPNFWLVHWGYGFAYNLKGEYPMAEKPLRRALDLDRNPVVLSLLGYTYAKLGKKAEAEELLRELESLSQQRYVSPYHQALIYTGLDQKDKALEMLEKTYEEHDLWFAFLKIEKKLDPLRSDPKFQELYSYIKFN